MWLREEKTDGLAFIVIEPGGIIPDYSIEISDGDVDLLKLLERVLVSNIVTLPMSNLPRSRSTWLVLLS